VGTSLRVASFNAQDFYLLLDGEYSRPQIEALGEAEYQAMNGSIYNRNKGRDKVAEVARIILEGDFDLVGLCEIGGMETLAAFNRAYLGGRYACHLHEANSRRGIFVGALVKRERLPRATARNVPVAFSRNLLELDLGPEGGGLKAFVVHLKSQHGEDRGLERRVREVEALASLVRTRRCLVMGDFNGILIRGEAQFEYGPFLELPFRDVLDILGVPPDERRTHYHFGPEPNFAQLDYLFCSEDLEVLDGGVIEAEIPLNRAQRALLPSDHLLIWAEIGTGSAGGAAAPAGEAASGPEPRGPRPLRAALRRLAAAARALGRRLSRPARARPGR